VPPTRRRGFRSATIAFEITFAILALGSVLLRVAQGWIETQQLRAAPCPLCSEWHIDSATLLDAKGHMTQHWPQLDQGQPAVELTFNRADQAVLRDSAAI
jgi:hypothetical protein